MVAPKGALFSKRLPSFPPERLNRAKYGKDKRMQIVKLRVAKCKIIIF
jgi:hypothetical protein